MWPTCFCCAGHDGAIRAPLDCMLHVLERMTAMATCRSSAQRRKEMGREGGRRKRRGGGREEKKEGTAGTMIGVS